VLLTDKVVRAFYFALYWLGNFKTSGHLVGRLTCPPATTRLAQARSQVFQVWGENTFLGWKDFCF